MPKPPPRRPEPLAAAHPQDVFDRERVVEGERLFYRHCVRCHAYRGVPNGYPNLWNLSPAVYEALDAIVGEGTMAENGMPAYGDILSRSEIAAIREFLLADESRFRQADRR